MSPQLATIVYGGLIALIFYLDRDKSIRTSKALWIPIAWLLINGSRPVSLWFQSGPTTAQQYAEGNPLDAAIYGVLILAAGIVLTRRRKSIAVFIRQNPAILIYVGYCLLSIAWSDYSFIAFKRWIKSAGDVMMILIVLSDRDQIGAVERFFSRAAYVLIPTSILLIKYYPQLGRTYDPWTWTPMFCGVTTFKNELGMTTLICGLGILWCFVRTLQDRGRDRRWQHLAAHGIILAMVIWTLHIANSMTSFSCFLMAGTILVFSSFSWVARRRGLVHIMVAGAISLSIFALFFNSSGDMVETLGRNSTLTGRTAIWHEVIKLSNERPILGTGFESFWMGDRLQAVWRVEKGIQEAHDGYLEVYANLGWVGIAALALVIFTGYRHVMRTYRTDRNLGSIKIAFFATALIYSLTEAGFREMCPVWLGFLLAVIVVPAGRVRSSTAPKPVKRAAHQDLEIPSYVSASRPATYGAVARRKLSSANRGFIQEQGP
jgi:O-antigen ligase